MGTTLYAGAARRAINPQLGTGKAGPAAVRLADPGDRERPDGDGARPRRRRHEGRADRDRPLRDQHGRGRPPARRRRRGARHARLPRPPEPEPQPQRPALPEFMAMTDSAEDVPFRVRYERDLLRWLVEAALEADGRLQPARIGSGWGESTIGVYRRETRDGRDVLGEVPDHPIDPSVGVIRVDDLDGNPIAVALPLLRPPGHRREPVAGRLGRTTPDRRGRCSSATSAASPSSSRAAAATSTPASGSATRSTAATPRTASASSSAARRSRSPPQIRTNTRAGERRPLGNVPNILFTPWEPVDGDTCTHLAAAETTVALDYDELPSLEQARAILAHWQQTREERLGRRRPRLGDPRRPEVRALGREARRRGRGRAPDPRTPHPGDPRQRHRRRAR